MQGQVLWELPGWRAEAPPRGPPDASRCQQTPADASRCQQQMADGAISLARVACGDRALFVGCLRGAWGGSVGLGPCASGCHLGPPKWNIFKQPEQVE